MAFSVLCKSWIRWLPLCAVVGVVSCDGPEQRAIKELSRRGIEASGRSLLEAATEGDAQKAEWLLQAGVFRESVDARGRTPLRIAVDQRNAAVASRLVAGGADVNAAAADGTSILGLALELELSGLAELLITAGARADGRMSDQEKILPWAVIHGRWDAVDSLLRMGADPHLADRNHNPILHLAMAAGAQAVAHDLIARGADAATVDAAERTTLHHALDQGWLEMIPQLCSAGADPNRRIPGELTPLQAAVRARTPDKVSALLAAGADPHFTTPDGPESALDIAMAARDPGVLTSFFEHGVRLRGPRAAALLLEAVERGDSKGVALLLAHGAGGLYRGRDFLLPVEASAARGQGRFVKLLLDYGQPPGNALRIAAARGDEHTAGLLLACGVHPNVTQAPFVDTPLAAAIRGRHDRLASMLIRHGADPRLRLPEGQTPLHLAIVTGCAATVGQLLEAGADPNIAFSHPVAPRFIKQARQGVIRWALKNDRNVTPLMVAADAGDLTITRQLLAAGAKKGVWTRNSKLWPINFASRRNDIKMMRLLLGRDPVQEERHIVINLTQQKAWLYDGDGNEIFTTRVSTGKKGKVTPTGEFVITNKHRQWTSTIYDSNMPYFQRLNCGDFGIHQGYVPGYPASSGCIRIPAGNAAKLFAMTQAGDRVRIDP